MKKSLFMIVALALCVMCLFACNNDIRPALTKLTTITVVALELWITDVTTVPTNIPIILLLVIIYFIIFINSEAKKENVKWDYIKLELFCVAKETLKKEKAIYETGE